MLSAVVIVCLVVAISLVGYAVWALPSELAVQREVKNTAEQLGRAVAASTTSAGGFAGQVQPQALSAGTDFVKALATLGDSMSKLRSGTSALLLAFGILIFAGIAAGVDDKVPDASTTEQQTSQR
jgi:hypothetical protein